MSTYYNRVKDRVSGTELGMKNRAYIAPLSWFDQLQEAPTSGTYPGDLATITGTHTFLESYGFLEAYCAKNANNMTATTTGEVGSRNIRWTGQIFLPGDGAAVQELIQALLNDDLIVLMEDGACPDTTVYQLGCDCKPADFDTVEFATQTIGADGRKGYTINIVSDCRWVYEGTITVRPQADES